VTAPTTPEEFFAGQPLGLATYEWVRSRVAELGGAEVRVTPSQVAFRRRQGFAFLWRPGQYLDEPESEVVLTLVLDRHDPSPRFEEVVHPGRQWVHHLQVRDLADLDDEVEGWLREAYEDAG
jgi:hypothetical protein